MVAIKITYIIHILTFFIIWYLLHKSPNHFFIRKGLIYTVLAFSYFFCINTYDEICSYLGIEKKGFSDIVIGPITTVYHLYFFLLVASGIFVNKWFWKRNIKFMFLFLLMVLVVIDTINLTIIFSYLYTNILIIILSILYFKIKFQNFKEKIIFNPEDWILAGYFVFSITLIPLTIIVDYITKTNIEASTFSGFYPALFKILILIPPTFFYSALTYGCYKFWLDAKKVFVLDNRS